MTAELMDPLAAAFRLDGTNGEAVVLIHGFTGVPAHFRPAAATFNKAGYTVNVPRLAGHGTNVSDLANTRGSDWIESAREAIDEVADHDRVHLAGLSMGGLLSLLLAVDTNAATVTTINSPAIVYDKKFYLSPIGRYFVRDVEWADTSTPALDPEVQQYWLPYESFPTRSAADLFAIIRRALWAARKITVPSLVVQSRVDETVDPRSGKILKILLGDDCRLVWLDESIHCAVLDSERDEISAAMLDRFRG
jgi:carboxylesterase